MSDHPYQSGVFERLDKPTILQLLKSEGWTPVEISDRPGHVYPPHRHPETKLIAILSGGMDVKLGEEMYRCLPGDRLLIHGEQEHAAMVGPDGCTYFWSEQVRA